MKDQYIKIKITFKLYNKCVKLLYPMQNMLLSFLFICFFIKFFLMFSSGYMQPINNLIPTYTHLHTERFTTYIQLDQDRR